MKTARTLLAVLFALANAPFGFTSAHAEGETFFGGSFSGGARVGAPGNSQMTFGSFDGSPATFQGSSFTTNGQSSFNGFVGGNSFVSVPQGTTGSAQSTFSVNHSINSGHIGGSGFTSQSFNGNTNSSVVGSGNANVEIRFGQSGNSSWTAPTFFGGKG